MKWAGEEEAHGLLNFGILAGTAEPRNVVISPTMRLPMRALLGLFLMLSCHASPQSEDSQFGPLVATFLDTWNKHDAHAFAGIFAVDAVVTTVGGTRTHGREELEKHMQPSFTGPVFKDSVYSATIKSSRLISADVAILDLDWEMNGARTRDGGLRPPRKGTLNWVVVKKDGRWEITSYHNSEFAQASSSRAQ